MIWRSSGTPVRSLGRAKINERRFTKSLVGTASEVTVLVVELLALGVLLVDTLTNGADDDGEGPGCVIDIVSTARTQRRWHLYNWR